MLGHIESYNPETQTGVIKSEQQSFDFDLTAWAIDVPPDEGDDVNFHLIDGKISNINLQGAQLEAPKAVKYKYVAAVLALFLGFTGAHRFYLGFYKLGLAQLALTAATVGYGAVWGFIDAILLFTGNINKDSNGRPLK